MDIRERMQRVSNYGNLPKPSGNRCTHCESRAKAVRSTPEFTYFAFECQCAFAQNYKQSRSHDAIARLREKNVVARRAAS